MSKPANAPFAAEYRAPKSQVAFIAAVALAILALWAAATCLMSLPLSFDEAVLLRLSERRCSCIDIMAAAVEWHGRGGDSKEKDHDQK